MGALDFSQMSSQELFELALKGDTQQLVVRIKQDNRYLNKEYVCSIIMHVQQNPLFRLISARDDNGRTALHWACSGGHKEIVQWLAAVPSEIAIFNTCCYGPPRWKLQRFAGVLPGLSSLSRRCCCVEPHWPFRILHRQSHPLS